MRHIAIVGMAFCGSTVLSYVLGALPGVANVGESHWASVVGRNTRCHYCGPACRYWTKPFFESLQADQANWYARLGAQMERDVVVSSDKDRMHLDRFDPELDLDALILFRPPVDAWRSYIAKKRKIVSATLDEYMRWWVDFHRKHAQLPNRGNRYYVDFDAFRAAPARELEALCARLELPFAATALEYWMTPQHAIGGHFNPFQRLQEGLGERLPIKALNGAPPTAEEAEAMSRNGADAVYKEMIAQMR